MSKIINTQTHQRPTLTEMVLIGRFSDGTRRQIIISQDEQSFILGVLKAVSPTGNINVKQLKA